MKRKINKPPVVRGDRRLSSIDGLTGRGDEFQSNILAGAMRGMTSKPAMACQLLLAFQLLTNVQAELNNPVLTNASFEEPTLASGESTGGITGWYDSSAYTYTVNDSAGSGTHPATSYGDNWAEFGNQRWMYQQIGTYEENMELDVSFLLGSRTDKGMAPVHVSLLVGGDPALAADVNSKFYSANPLESVVGATVVDTWEVDALTEAGTIAEVTAYLSSGTGHTVGAPMWLQINVGTDTSRVLIDNVDVVPGTGAPGSGGRPAASNGPNVVFILVDDWGWTDHSNAALAQGYQSDFYQTPNFTKMIESGVAFTSTYVQPNCAPTRAAIISGQYSPRSGNGVYNVASLSRAGGSRTTYTQPAKQVDEHVGGDEQTVTVGEAFVNSGYVTAHFGKYHAGSSNETDPTFPLNQGFDYNFGGGNKGNPGNYHASAQEFHNNVGPELDAFAQDYDNSYIADNLEPYSTGNDPSILKNTDKHITDAMADAFVSFMDGHRAGAMSDYPVYVQLNFYAVHAPFQPRADLLAKYNGLPAGAKHDHAKYAAMIEGMDHSLGRVMDYLDDPNGDGDTSDSIAENTLLVFCSDNGGYSSATNNAPLRGVKGMHYSGGMRVPAVVRMPGTIPAGKVSDTLVHAVDFYPTMLDFADGVFPDTVTYPLDGESIHDHLLDPDSTARDRKPIFYHFPGYMDNRAYACSAVIKEIDGKRYKYIYAYDPYYEPGSGEAVGFDQYQLYNLTDDIGESVNLLDYIDIENADDPNDPSTPEEYSNYIAHKDIANELATDLHNWLVGDPGDTTWNPIYATYKDIYPGIAPELVDQETGPPPATIPDLGGAENVAPVANDATFSIVENSAVGTSVGSVVATDTNSGDTLSYAITAGNDLGGFLIDSSTGEITTAVELDYETSAQYVLTITVSDNGTPVMSDTASVTIDVTDVAEVSAPVIATGTASNITQTEADVFYSLTDDGGEASTVTLYHGESDGGQSAGVWTNSSDLGVKATGSYFESLSGLTAGTNYFYTVHAMNSEGEVWGSTASFTTEADSSTKMVRTTVSAVSSSNWINVDLGQNYNSAVIVATPMYPDSTGVPLVTRIRNVSGSTFEVKLDRADGLTDEVTCDVAVLAVEEGVYTLATDGVQMEAVKFTSTVTARKNNWNAEARTYQNSYTNPVVLGQVMSANDSNWSTFWSMGSSRTEAADASNFSVGKQIGADTNTSRADETVGYIVIESGNGTINGVAYEAGLGADLPEGVDETTTGWDYSLSGNLASASAAVVSQAAMDGNDGSWAVLYGATPFTTTSLTLVLDEDQIKDSERSHQDEQVSYLIFE